MAIISFFLTKGEGAIGALDMPQEGRRQLALKSKTWTCPVCHSDNATSLPNEETAPSIRLESEPEITLTQVAASRADPSSSADKQLAKPSLQSLKMFLRSRNPRLQFYLAHHPIQQLKENSFRKVRKHS